MNMEKEQKYSIREIGDMYISHISSIPQPTNVILNLLGTKLSDDVVTYTLTQDVGDEKFPYLIEVRLKLIKDDELNFRVSSTVSSKRNGVFESTGSVICYKNTLAIAEGFDKAFRDTSIKSFLLFTSFDEVGYED